MIRETFQPCKGGTECDHTLHLCRLLARTRDHERVRSFVRDPMYYCRNCGRVAHDESRLCRPVLL